MILFFLKVRFQRFSRCNKASFVPKLFAKNKQTLVWVTQKVSTPKKSSKKCFF